jgi:hypothetical protein
VELAGSEQSVSSDQMIRDTSLRQFATRSFNCLSAYLLKISTGKKVTEEDCSLTHCLKKTLTSQSNVLLVACVPPGANLFEHTLPAVKFCSRIRESIVKRASKKKSNDLIGSI